MIRQILTTTDFSEESRAGVRYAIALAEKLKAAVSLLHVIEPLPAMARMEVVPIVTSDQASTKWARTQLMRLAKREGESSLPLTSFLRTGKAFHEITAAASENATDLIVMATHGYTGVSHLILGSTAERVVRHARCPVLTVRAPVTTKRIREMPPFKLKRLLVPIDFSDVSKEALPWATFLATRFKAEIILVHVTEKFPIDYLLGRDLMNHAIMPLMKQAEAELQDMAASMSESTRVKASVVVRDGTPYQEICQVAKALRADLVVLTTHGYTGLKHVWLGSTAERVVRHATCPVLTVRGFKQKK